MADNFENKITNAFGNYNQHEIRILSFACGKHVTKEQLKQNDIKVLKNSDVIYQSGFYCCPLKCKRNDE
jgi:hypothetical protein